MSVKKLIFTVLFAVEIWATTPMTIAASLPDFSSIVDTEGKAVVNISTQATIRETVDPFGGLGLGREDDPFFEFFRRFGPPLQQQERKMASLGSGFIISPDGYILTNAHVVARADEITVQLIDKREFKAKVIGADGRTDIAILKINAQNLPVVRQGDPNALKVGNWVLAIGSPFGFENTATSGIVSGKNRFLPDGRGGGYVPFIQTDAAVNPGNSGGPLFNMKGEVVGINSQIFSRSGGFMGISFAIPIDVAIDIAQQLKAKGHITRAKIGVTVQPLSKDLANSFGLNTPSGALVNGIEKDSPAEKAGLKTGDVILKANGQAIDNPSDLQRYISSTQPGHPMTLAIWRGKTIRSLTIIPTELIDENDQMNPRSLRGENPASTRGEKNLASAGLRVQPLNPSQLKQLKLNYGLLIHSVKGAAARSGLQPGDIVVGIAGEPLTSIEQLSTTIQKVQKGSVALQIRRQGNTLFVPLTLGDDDK